MNNLLIPVVGDSPDRLPFVKSAPVSLFHDATVTAFYLSNVERYLFDRRRAWPELLCQCGRAAVRWKQRVHPRCSRPAGVHAGQPGRPDRRPDERLQPVRIRQYQDMFESAPLVAALIKAIELKRKMFFEHEQRFPTICLDVEHFQTHGPRGSDATCASSAESATRAVFDRTFKAGDKSSEPDLTIRFRVLLCTPTATGMTSWIRKLRRPHAAIRDAGGRCAAAGGQRDGAGAEVQRQSRSASSSHPMSS